MLGLRRHATDRRGCIRSRAVGEPKVEQHHVGLQVCRPLGGVCHRARMADDGHVALRVEQRAEAVRDHLVVFDDQDAGLLDCGHFGNGTQNSTIVPAPGSLLILPQPPASSGLSLSARSPRCPGRRSLSETMKPVPLSVIAP